MFLDITERKQIEARQIQLLNELKTVNQELNDFAYIVSHDLRAHFVELVHWQVGLRLIMQIGLMKRGKNKYSYLLAE